VVRKNIKDNESKVNDALERMKEATGLEWEFECDYATAYALYKEKNATSSYLDRIGEMVACYLTPLAEAVQTFCKHPMQKEALIEGATAKKITFTLLKDNFKNATNHNYNYSDYCRCLCIEGVLSIQVPVSRFPSNVSDIGSSLKVCFDDPNALSLLCRLDIARHTEKLQENLEKIKKVSGVDMELEVDFQTLIANWKKGVPTVAWNSTDRIGETIYSSYMGGLADQIGRVCRDDMGKEAFAEAITKKIINIVILPELKKGESFYSRCRIVDGKLILEIPAKSFPCNCSDAGSDLEKLL